MHKSGIGSRPWDGVVQRNPILKNVWSDLKVKIGQDLVFFLDELSCKWMDFKITAQIFPVTRSTVARKLYWNWTCFVPLKCKLLNHLHFIYYLNTLNLCIVGRSSGRCSVNLRLLTKSNYNYMCKYIIWVQLLATIVKGTPNAMPCFFVQMCQ